MPVLPIPVAQEADAQSTPTGVAARHQVRADWLIRAATWLCFLGLPFLVVTWLLPFIEGKTIGNDYPIFSLRAQLDLMWSVHKGTFPLYMPGFSVGHSTAAMTLGQLYHPISWVASVMPRYWDGQALEWNTFLHLLSLGCVHLFLFHICRRLRMGRVPAFICTFPVVYNLRMLDSFRYGAALEGYTGMLLAAGAAALVFLDDERKGRTVWLAISVCLLATSGHPQWFFLGMAGALLWAAALPWLIAAINPIPMELSLARLKQYYARAALGVGAGLALAMPYLLTFYFEFFRTNQSRAANTSYEWTLAYSDGLRGELSNFFYPLHSDVHGAFGGSAVFLIAALLPVGALFKRPPRALLWVYAFAVIALLFAAGAETPLHRFIIEHVPFFGSFRTPGRLVIWIPLAMLPIVAWLFRPSSRRALLASTVAAAAASLWFALRPSHILPAKEDFSPVAILAADFPRHYNALIVYLSLATALGLLAAVVFRRIQTWGRLLAAGTMLATTWLCLAAGTWQSAKVPSYSHGQMAVDRAHSTSGHSAGGEGYGMEMRSVSDYRGHDLDPSRPLGRIFHQVSSAESDDAVLDQLSANKGKDQLFVDGPVGEISPERTAPIDSVTLVYNTSNRFKFDVLAGRDGYFVLGLPWLPGFACRVDGRFVPVVRANALNPAVYLRHGSHRVDFIFVSWPFLGGLALALAAVAALSLWCVRRTWRPRLATALSLSIVPTGLLVWFLLYAGPSFGTSYVWQAPL
jgi:hypothetical protein